MSHDHARGSAAVWSHAWRRANAAFYEAHNAESHFETSLHHGREVATVIADVITEDYARYEGDEFFVIDIGAGSGRLLEHLRAVLPPEIQLLGIDIRERPEDLPVDIDWRQRHITVDTDDLCGIDGQVDGVLIAHEFLDDIPCTIVELDEERQPRIVLVDSVTGVEEIGPLLTDSSTINQGSLNEAMLEWLHHWWPATRPGARREIGIERAATWQMITGVLRSGTAIAIDYAHEKDGRAAGLWDGGTLKGFSRGRPRRPVPDGSMNLTAHVALDSLALPGGRIVSQAEVLDGVTLASWPGGLGSYSWLFQPIGSKST